MRALLRHGASLDAGIAAPCVDNSPIRCAIGSNALHIAALIGNVAMAKLILEAQVSAMAGGEGIAVPCILRMSVASASP